MFGIGFFESKLEYSKWKSSLVFSDDVAVLLLNPPSVRTGTLSIAKLHKR